MSDDRQFEPTPRRMTRALAEGDVARSAEATALAAFAGAAAALSLTLTPMLGAARAMLTGSLVGRRPAAASVAQLLICAASIPAAAAAAAVLCALLQARFTIAVGVLAPRLERINPFEGVKRLLSRETPLHVLRWLSISAAIALCGLHALRAALTRDLAGDPQAAIDAGRRVCGALLAPALMLGAAGGVLELATSRRAWLRRLRMSRDEIRREARESEGDPHRKAERARLHRSLRGSLRAVRKATVLLVNPTHVAVALRYHPGEAPVPVVVAKGADARAAALRTLAERCGVPIVEEVGLARLLFAEVSVGEAIPEPAFAPVAVIIAAIVRNARATEEAP
ncbi:MAG: EscU/YscU/HrcU family type III secretion system export apparatus switch protein [bacterium]|nr:EscU/YscU/HrcU family type III secretion system export apparatus switch protein [bacterium]